MHLDVTSIRHANEMKLWTYLYVRTLNLLKKISGNTYNILILMHFPAFFRKNVEWIILKGSYPDSEFGLYWKNKYASFIKRVTSLNLKFLQVVWKSTETRDPFQRLLTHWNANSEKKVLINFTFLIVKSFTTA